MHLWNYLDDSCPKLWFSVRVAPPWFEGKTARKIIPARVLSCVLYGIGDVKDSERYLHPYVQRYYYCNAVICLTPEALFEIPRSLLLRTVRVYRATVVVVQHRSGGLCSKCPARCCPNCKALRRALFHLPGEVKIVRAVQGYNCFVGEKHSGRRFCSKCPERCCSVPT